jgi:tetratricopeptide (TPR) repeat protein
MKNGILGFLSAFLLLTSVNLVYAQKLSEIAKLEKTAGDMARQSYKLIKADKLEEAKKLLFAGNKIYPLSGDLRNLAETYLKQGDLKSYNSVMDTAAWGLKQVPKDSYYTINKPLYLFYNYQSKAQVNIQQGDPSIAIRAIKGLLQVYNGDILLKEHAISNLLAGLDLAYMINDMQSVRELYNASTKIKSDRLAFVSSFYLKLSERKFPEAIVQLNNAVQNGGGFAFSKDWARYLLPFTYCEAGEFENAELSMSTAKKSIILGDKSFNYIAGLIALHKKDYNTALLEFSNSLKPYQVMLGKQEKPAKFRYYTKRAEAYIGLNNLASARKDLEAALIYMPDYEPALQVLAMLESRMVSDLITDKTPPVIVITEPAVNRGLKVAASGSDVMIKGKATDAAGIRSVSINGQKIYSKETGEFWGSMVLSGGLNKIAVQATDLAGNISEQVFEVEKKETINASNEIVPVKVKEGKNYAVLIASQNYDDTQIPSLENPVRDAIRLKMVLKSAYNFTDENILTLFNPERSHFRKKFLELTELMEPEDNLVVFYAGHGIWVDKEKKGYWLLTDAKRNDVNTWLPNKEVLEMIANVQSRHTLLITDACFSGSVFRTRSIDADAPPAVREMSEKISRVAITSGNDTEVPDESVFMKYLVKALSENKDKYLTAQKMFINQIIEAVMAESKTEPRYGTLELAGHVGGDYIFTKK